MTIPQFLIDAFPWLGGAAASLAALTAGANLRTVALRLFQTLVSKLLRLRRSDFDAAVRVIIALDKDAEFTALTPDEKRGTAQQLLSALLSHSDPDLIKRLRDAAYFYVRAMQWLGVAEWQGFALRATAPGANPETDADSTALKKQQYYDNEGQLRAEIITRAASTIDEPDEDLIPIYDRDADGNRIQIGAVAPQPVPSPVAAL